MNKEHPVITSFLNAKEPLGNILEKYCDKNQALEVAFKKLAKEVASRQISADLLSSIDRAIKIGHPDSSLFIFFICQVASHYRIHNQKEKLNTLFHIGSSINLNKIHPFIHAVFLSQLAIKKRTEGRVDECNQLMKASLSLIDIANEPRSIVLVQNYITNIAFSGTLKENNKYDFNEIIGLPPEEYFVVTSQAKIHNCIVTGNTQEGMSILNESKEKIEKIHGKDIVSTCIDLLKISEGNFNKESYVSPEGKDIVTAFEKFSIGDYEEGMCSYNLYINKSTELLNKNLTLDYFPIHYELCLKRSGRAKLLMQEKVKNGGSFYLDDLFYGRIQLLENDNADQSFLRLISNITRFNANNRLEFELQFAKEMRLPIILKLLGGWRNKDTVLTTNSIKVNKKSKAPNERNRGVELLIGQSKSIKYIKSLIKKYANIEAPVLITGATGTGKELVAKAIHEEGLFSKEPFLAVNCGALTETLLQSELFGYKSGAFTGAQKERKGIFEAAKNGTVFLDEFGGISPKLQVSLLRVLESNEIRMIGSTETSKIKCKIVVATSSDLKSEVIQNNFREDLFFRLARFEIKLPRLHERVSDIPLLIDYFLSTFSNNKSENFKISTNLLNELKKYKWPGNIRELKNEIERLYLLNPGIYSFEIEHFDFTHLQNYLERNSQMAENNMQFKNSNLMSDDTYQDIIQNGFKVEKRHNMIKELFKKHRKLTRNQIMKIVQIGPTTATKDLKTLAELGFIVRRTPTKSTSTHYFELAM